MKKVFSSHNEVCHIWAQQTQREGEASRMFFEGGTIYSYGKHFPIATIEGGDVFFTLRGYSSSTSKHKSRASRAVSHKNFIYCYEVPIKFWGNDKPLSQQSNSSTHEINLNAWKGEINELFNQLGDKKIRNVQDRINSIGTHIERLNKYCNYFNIKVKDPELKSLLKLAASPDFLSAAREAREKQDAKDQKKMQQASKAYDQYISLWREYREDEIKELPQKIKDLCNYYISKQEAFTRLRFNADQNRVETSKGVQIPVGIAQKAFIQLNGCMEGSCKNISVPVLHYTITETGKDYIKAGCHTIPKSDVWYIADLLNWTKG